MLDEERGAFRGGARLAYGLSAALLADLEQLGRIEIGDRVRAVDRARTGHAILDEQLERIAAAPPRRVEDWIVSSASGILVDRIAERLVVAGTLASRVDRSLGLFSVRRYRIVPPRLATTLWAHVRGVVVGDDHAVPAEHARVAAILAALGERRLLARARDRATALRAEALIRDDGVATALARVLALGARADESAAVAAIL